MRKSMPVRVFSIITVTYNAINTIEKTIQSVLAQDKDLFEYIIIDGGSTDGTVSCIEKYANQLSFWCSEQDNGIYDAMNKGLNQAKGEWILFLGADDRLTSNVLRQVFQYLDSSIDLVYGNIMFNNGRRFISQLSLKTIINNTVHHQGAFYNKKLFYEFRYDTHLRAMSDYELNLLIYLYGKKRRKINIDIAECDVNGVSFEISSSLKEINFIHAKYFRGPVKYILSKLLQTKYFLHYDVLRKI